MAFCSVHVTHVNSDDLCVLIMLNKFYYIMMIMKDKFLDKNTKNHACIGVVYCQRISGCQEGCSTGKFPQPVTFVLVFFFSFQNVVARVLG